MKTEEAEKACRLPAHVEPSPTVGRAGFPPVARKFNRSLPHVNVLLVWVKRRSP